MKRFRHVLVLFFLLLCTNLYSQDSIYSKNAVYCELLGNAGLASLNYERLFTGQTYVRIGYTGWSSSYFGSGTEFFGFPIMINGFTGKKRNHFEVGGGVLTGRVKEVDWFDEKKSSPVLKLTFLIGYRYQAKGNGLLFRAGLTPFFSLDDNTLDMANLSGGTSIGYHF